MSASIEWCNLTSQSKIPPVFPHIPNNHTRYAYGTAGFRGHSDVLIPIASRIGAIAALRSESLNNSFIGVMITASHNPEEDNGFKIIDEDGGMLHQSWEQIAEDMVNCDDTTSCSLLELIKRQKGIVDLEYVYDLPICLEPTPSSRQSRPVVMVGRDTRPSSDHLMQEVIKGIVALGGVCINYGVCTTPQLHFMVGLSNSNDQYKIDVTKGSSLSCTAHLPSLQDYYTRIGTAFNALLPRHHDQPLPSITVDCANGVGAYAFQHLWATQTITTPSLSPVNIPSHEVRVNDRCGIDFLLNHGHSIVLSPDDLSVPYPALKNSSSSSFLLSVDGDCDRVGVIVPGGSPQQRWRVFDGDRINALLTKLIQHHLSTLNQHQHFQHLVMTPASIYTGYSNGGLINLVKTTAKGFMTCTGVKHLIAEAKKHDISVYFECNGHGSIVFSPQLVQALLSFIQLYPLSQTLSPTGGQPLSDQINVLLKQHGLLLPPEPPTPKLTDVPTVTDEQIRSALTLLWLNQLINPFIGDGVAMGLAVYVALLLLDPSMSPHQCIQQWERFYKDSFSRQKTVVVNRHLFRVKEDTHEQEVANNAVQLKINEIVQQYHHASARSFVRPSGTQDCVRIFVESTDLDVTNALLSQIEALVHHVNDAPDEY